MHAVPNSSIFRKQSCGTVPKILPREQISRRLTSVVQDELEGQVRDINLIMTVLVPELINQAHSSSHVPLGFAVDVSISHNTPDAGRWKPRQETEDGAVQSTDTCSS